MQQPFVSGRFKSKDPWFFCRKSTFGEGCSGSILLGFSFKKLSIKASRNFTTTNIAQGLTQQPSAGEVGHIQATCNIFCVWMQREYAQQPALDRRGCISCNGDGTLGGGMYPKVSVCMYMYILIDKYIHILHGIIFSFSMAYLDPNTSYISSVSVVPTKTSKNHG